ncbi:hypothetical protein P8C59_004341 [Phyllachora maydis]|uniref:Peroxisomal membrane protein PEX14 n=1 Tax=Phyllachora maydis TaxID=1825666 RepID=A0AAD9MAB0_9PEZI|nr:hypothetical protein P8C59_004341 [Phyllachora maydis]
MVRSDGTDEPATPAWQRQQTGDEASGSNSQATAAHAKKFLEDDAVRGTSREEKKEFLRTKGIPEKEIEGLLDEDAAQPGKAASPAFLSQQAQPAPAPAPAPAQDQPSQFPPPQPRPERREDRAPIIIYPEFLTKSAKPPPLITAKGLVNILSAFAGLSGLLYGTAKYVLEPMVDALTEARLSLYETAKADVDKLVEQLEGTVSEMPPIPRKSAGRATDDDDDEDKDDDDDDDDSSYGDPSELFHRDVGVQTSRPPSPTALASPLALAHAAGPRTTAAGEKSAAQARRVAELVAELRTLRDGLLTQSEDYGDVRGRLGVFRDELDKLTYPPSTTYSGLYSGSGGFGLHGGSSLSSSSSSEPHDEIRKAKENIRRLKGVMLGARSFPGARS